MFNLASAADSFNAATSSASVDMLDRCSSIREVFCEFAHTIANTVHDNHEKGQTANERKLLPVPNLKIPKKQNRGEEGRPWCQPK